MQESVTLRTARIAAIRTTIGGSALLRIFNGVPPLNCASPDPAWTGLLCTILLPPVPLAEGSGISSQVGVWATQATGSGFAQSFRIYDGAFNCHMQGFVSEAWQPGFNYSAGQQASNANGIFSCVNPGMSLGSGTGPVNTPSGTGIIDGGVTWNFLAPAPDLVLQTTQILNGQTITIASFAVAAGNA